MRAETEASRVWQPDGRRDAERQSRSSYASPEEEMRKAEKEINDALAQLKKEMGLD